MAHALKDKIEKLTNQSDRVALKGNEIKKLLKIGKSPKQWKIPTKLK